MVEGTSRGQFLSTDAGRKEHARQALILSESMLLAREEEQALSAAGASQQIVFKLPGDGDATVGALRAIIAARAFRGRLMGCKDQKALASQEGEQATGGDAPAQAEPAAPAGGGTPEIELPGVKKDALQASLGYAYTGNLDVRDENWKELLECAEAMGMDGAKELIEAFLRQPGKLPVPAVCEALELAHRCAAEGLKEHCMTLIDKEPASVFGHESFLRLPKDVVTELFSRDTLVIDELSIFQAVLAWGKERLAVLTAEHGQAQQSEAGQPAEGAEGADVGVAGGTAKAEAPRLGGALQGVIDVVRFPLIPPEALRDTVQPALAGGDAGGRAIAEWLILEGYQHHALVKIGQQSKVDKAKTRPRAGAQKPALQGIAGGDVGDALQRAQRTARWLRSLPQSVERISMASMRLGDDDAVLIGDFLKTRGRSLVELDLKCNSLTAASLQHILTALPNCPRLTGLALGENPLGPGAGTALAETLLKDCRNLEKLGLGGTQLGDDGLAAIVPALAGHGMLRTIGLSSNGLTPVSVTSLVDALRANTNVATVVLAGNGLSRQHIPFERCRAGLTLKMS